MKNSSNIRTLAQVDLLCIVALFASVNIYGIQLLFGSLILIITTILCVLIIVSTNHDKKDSVPTD